ncbi:MAG TPA: ABC transporter permease [Terriglobia bacterium]|nr:ABC transporter permease [Terriglobia bacterium]
MKFWRWGKRRNREADLERELRGHLELEAEDQQASGESPEEAAYAARRALGNTTQIKENVRAAWGLQWLETLFQDLRYGLRQLRHNPGFTAVAVLTLALGIGANTTVFTVVNTLILNPLPVEKPSELVGIYAAPAPSQNAELIQLSYPNLQDLQERNRVLSSLAGFTWPMYVTLTRDGAAERMFAEFVTGNYFETLGIHPAFGRFFLPQENRAPGESPVAILSYAAWKALGGTPDVVGRTILVNRVALTVVGVAQRGFLGVSAMFGPDVWVPATMSARLFPAQGHDWLHDRGQSVMVGAARLKNGVTLEKAAADLKGIAAALQEEYPEPNRGRTLELLPLNDVALSMRPTPRQGATQPLILTALVLMAIVGIVLLIACSNVANLLMARAASRRQEMAVRLALGAGRGRLNRQLLVESLLLSLLGGLAGLGVAYAGTRILWSFRESEFAQNLADLKFDAHVFVFTLAVALATAFVFGIIPAFRSSRAAIADTLKDDLRTTAGPTMGRRKFASAVLVGQVALSLVSLVTAALFIHSIERAYALDPGFDTAHTAMFFMSPGQAGYSRARAEQIYREVRTRIAALPGVNSVSWSSNLPLWGKVANNVLIEGRQTGRASEAISTIENTVDLDYFATMRIPLLRGRDFNAEDKEGSLPVAIVNETMAKAYWPGQDPIGKRFRFTGQDTYRQIVGVAKTVEYSSLGESAQPCIYLPLRQNFSGTMVLNVNTHRDPAMIFDAVQQDLRQLDPQLPPYDFRTGRKIIDQALSTAKMGVGLLGVFGLLALGLASVGLYGVMAYSVNQRRHEIGVRMALGASSASILRHVLLQGVTLVGAGIALGLAASFVLNRGLTALLYGVSPADPLSVAGASLVLAIVAGLACYIPARRASRVDPMVALRYE